MEVRILKVVTVVIIKMINSKGVVVINRLKKKERVGEKERERCVGGA